MSVPLWRLQGGLLQNFCVAGGRVGGPQNARTLHLINQSASQNIYAYFSNRRPKSIPQQHELWNNKNLGGFWNELCSKFWILSNQSLNSFDRHQHAELKLLIILEMGPWHLGSSQNLVINPSYTWGGGRRELSLTQPPKRFSSVSFDRRMPWKRNFGSPNFDNARTVLSVSVRGFVFLLPFNHLILSNMQ